MSFVKIVARAMNRVITHYQKAQMLRSLLTLSDAQLHDIGISRYSLERGVAAYPWRGESESMTGARVAKPAADVLVFQHPVQSQSPAQDPQYNQPKLAA